MGALNELNHYYTQWDTEDAYNRAMQESNWAKKYQGKGYQELVPLLDSLEDGEEKQWLTDYAGYIDYDERVNMDLDAALREIQTLQDQLDRARNLEVNYNEYRNSPLLMLTQGDTWRDLEQRYDTFVDQYGGIEQLQADIDRKRQRMAEGKQTQDSIRQTEEYEQWKQNVRDPKLVQHELDRVNQALALNQRAIRDSNRGSTQQDMAARAEADAGRQALEQQRYALEQELQYGRMQEYAALMQRPDFAENSRYVPSGNGVVTLGNGNGPGIVLDPSSGMYVDTGFQDIAYDYINKNERAKKYANTAQELRTAGLDRGWLLHLTEEETGIFNYLYRTEGKDAAWEYLDLMRGELNRRQRQSEEAKWAEYAKAHPGWASAASIGLAPMKSVTAVGQLIDRIGDGRIDQNASYNRASYISSAIRDQVTQEIQKNEKWGQLGAFGYHTAMSMGDFLMNAAAGGGFLGVPGVTMAIMGSGAAADTVISAKDRGVGDAQAFGLGIVAGLAEALTERFSLEALLDADLLKNGIGVYMLKNSLTEGSEEVASSIINLWADIEASKEKSEWRQAIREYQDMGYSEEEAFAKAVADQAESMGMDFIGGMISGGVMSGATSAQYKTSTTRTGKALGRRSLTDSGQVQQILDAGAKTEKGTAANAVAARLQKKVDTGKKLTAYEKGQLYQSNPQEVSEAVFNQGSVQLADAYVKGIDNKHEDWKQAQRLASITGRDIRFYNGDPEQDGFFDRKTGEIFINVDRASEHQAAYVFSHELTHSTELGDSYVDLKNYIRGKLISEGRDWNLMKRQKAEAYANAGHILENDDDIESEVVAQYVQDNLLSNEQELFELFWAEPTIGQKILNWFDRLLAKFKKGENARERLYIEEARQKVLRAWESSNRARDREGRIEVTERPERTEQAGYSAENLDMMDQMYREQYDRGELTEEQYDEYLDWRVHEAAVEEGEAELGRQYSFAGTKAKTADHSKLQQAKQMKSEGVANETIRRRTGWFQGMDGKWRFEIDDSRMRYYKAGDALFSEMHPEYARHQELMQKWLYGELEGKEETEFRDLDEVWGREHQRLSDRVRRGNATLQNMLNHDKLFEAYPELRGAKVTFEDMVDGKRGQFDPDTNSITLSNKLRNAPQETLLHEVQHAIQSVENFTGGASVEYWKEQRRDIVETIAAARKNLDLWLADIGYPEAKRQSLLAVSRREKPLAQHWKDMEEFKANSDYARQIAACEAELADFQRQYDEITHGMTAYEQYENTAGEIEARDTANRWKTGLDEEGRKNTPPDLGDERTVFTERDARSFSIIDIEGERDNYGTGVLLDTNIFDGVRTSEWGKILSRFVYRNLAGSELTVFDDNGNSETIYLAKETDRVRKDGAKNSHKVIDKLARYKGDNIVALATVHLSELLETSQHDGNSNDHSHQWMDENGWIIRKAYIQDRSGNIYEAMLNIADGRDRKILYIINNVRRIDKRVAHGDVPSTKTGRGSHIKSNSSMNNVSEAEENVNRQYSLNTASVSKRDVARDLRAILSRGGDPRELQRYVEGLERNRPGAEQIGEKRYQTGENRYQAEENRNSTAQEILQAAHSNGQSVEEYLRWNSEQFERDGKWRPEALEAMRMEQGEDRQYSLRGEPLSQMDSEGRQLSQEQKEYFQDSKIRDENGNLKVMYHGSEKAGFTVFDGKFSDDGISLFFTDKPTVAESYSGSHEEYAPTKNDNTGAAGSKNYQVYLNIKTPLTVDARGTGWRKLKPVQTKYERVTLVDYQGKDPDDVFADLFGEAEKITLEVTEHGGVPETHVFNSIREMADFIGYGAEDIIELICQNAIGGSVKDIGGKPWTTREYSRYAKDNGFDGVVFQNIDDTGSHVTFESLDLTPDRPWDRKRIASDPKAVSTVAVAFDSNQVKSTANMTPTKDADIRYSLNDGENHQESANFQAHGISRDQLPTKAQNYLRRAEGTLLNRIGEALSIPRYVRYKNLQGIIQEISNVYLQEGTISDDKMDELFDKAYASGIITDAEFYNQYKEVKDHLKTYGVTISDRDKSDIPDFNDFRKRAFGTLRIVNEGGVPVDTAYQELQSMAPELFPDNITHPADQLMRMFDVGQSIAVSQKNLDEYYGYSEAEREEFRKWAKNDFDAAVGDAFRDLKLVKRYAEEHREEVEKKKILTTEDAEKCYEELKRLRRNVDKVRAKNLLSESDELLLGRMLKGEIGPQHLNPKEDNVKGITALYEAKLAYENQCEVLAAYKRSVRAKHLQQADELLETSRTWKDKKAGILYARETMRRNIMDIVPDQKVAERIAEVYFESVHIAEAKSTRFKNDYRDRVRALNLSTKVMKGNLVSEAHAVQLLGEAMDNIRVMESSRGRMWTRDGKTLTEWRTVVDDLWTSNVGLDRQKIENAMQAFRKIYDELFQQMNRIRVENGYEPVNYRQGYFPHFQPGGDGIMAFFGKAMGINTQVDSLPTTISGLTHTFKPGIQWFGNAQERLGFNTAYDAVEGFDKYIEGVASVIFQTENIQKLRALATQVRYRTTDKGIRKQVDFIRMDNRLTDEEKQTQINAIYEHGKFSLSNFVAELDEYTNLLANKKSKYDRTMESLIGRRAYMLMKNWENRVGANMIAGNISSAMTNFIPLTQAGAQLDSGMILKGMFDTLRNMKQGNSLVVASDFLTNRRGSDPLTKTWAQKASGILGTPMELIDNFTSESIVRAAYLQNLKRGMSEAEAMHQADIFAAGVMADRSKGAMPTLFESRNPLFKAFTQFQLEVNNQFSEVFKDLPRNHREKGLAVLAMVLLKYFLGAWLYNELFEKLIGRRPALDPIDMLNQTVGDLTGYEIPNLFDMGMDMIHGEDISFETEKVGIGEAGSNLATNVLSELPFSAGLNLFGVETDGGRLPAASAVPDLSAIWQATTDGELTGDQRWKMLQDELNKLAYVLPPFGGGQLSKSYKGIKAYLEGGSYSLDQDGNNILQYPIYKDDPDDYFWSLVRAAFMGKNSLPEAHDWVEDGYDSLNVKQTAVYRELLNIGMKDRDAYDLIRRIESITDTESRAQKGKRAKLILSEDVSGEVKNLLYYALLAGEAERFRMEHLTEEGVDPGAATELVYGLWRVGSDASSSEKWHDWEVLFSETPLTEEEKHFAMRYVLGEEMTTDTGNPSAYAKYLSAVELGLSNAQYMQIRNFGTPIDKYLELRDAGVRNDGAVTLAMDLDRLEPDFGKTSVSWLQKCQVITGSDLSEPEQMKALSTVMYESTYEKVEIGHNFGMNVKSYIDLKSIMPEFDANTNGSYSQQETEEAINALAGDDNVLYALTGTTPNGYILSDREKAILWQLQNKSWKPNRNPFDREVGQMVYDILTAEAPSDAVTSEGANNLDVDSLLALMK